jgi:hypothetical protein
MSPRFRRRNGFTRQDKALEVVEIVSGNEGWRRVLAIGQFSNP